ncbi:MAG: toxic anion resistance protein [Lachnospiraceae bacterium]|nr:toxic anion resistance protein [Lachnospiraceae bacterium]
MSDEIKLEFKQEIPTFNFDTKNPLTFGEEKKEEKAEDVKYMDSINLTEEEKQMVSDFAKQIDLNDSSAVLVYGASAQKKVAEFSDAALNGVRTKDLGEIGNTLASLVAEIKGFSAVEEEPKGLAKLFHRAENKLTVFKARYDKVEKNVDNIVGVLEGHQNQLTSDIVMLDKMYDSNMVYFKELTMYILAGKEKLAQERATTLPELQKKARETGLAEDAQKANDYAAICDRFEKKLYDLELTRTVSIQMAPQIRLVQNNDTLMTEKIQSTIINTIPLWKNQMVVALSLQHSKEALGAQKAVTDLTNELINKNAEALKQGTIEIAEESERGVVDIETVQNANTKLIETIDELVKIHEEGREKRALAEIELGKMEAQLKAKLLEVKENAETVK